jgi:hypothetical protein
MPSLLRHRPVVTAEGHGGQTFAVVEVAAGGVSPGVADGDGLGNGRAGDNDAIAFDLCLGVVPGAIFTGEVFSFGGISARSATFSMTSISNARRCSGFIAVKRSSGFCPKASEATSRQRMAMASKVFMVRCTALKSE